MEPGERKKGKGAEKRKEREDSDGDVHRKDGGRKHRGWDRVVAELVRFPESRRAVIALNQPDTDYGMKDVPCTMFVQFFIREGKLHMIWNMRSSDFAFGFCNDVAVGMLFMQMMRNELMMQSNELIDLGSFTYNATSFHCYDHHWSLIFDDNHDEVYDKYELRETDNWEHMLMEQVLMQDKDLKIEEIWEIVDEFERNHFVGGRL